MSNEKSNRPEFLTPGNASCALFCAAVGVLIAVLLLTIGFWRTLFITVMFFLGLFIGGVGDKKAFISGRVNKYFPQKELHPYKADDVKISIPRQEEGAEPAPDGEESAKEAPGDDAEDEAAEDTPAEEEAADGEPEEDDPGDGKAPDRE